MSVAMVARRTSVGRARNLNGTAVGIGFAVCANLIAFAGFATVLTPLFVGGAIATTYWLSRTRPVAALEFTFWLWLLGPQVRRVIDDLTSFHDPSLVLTAAPLASLVMVPRIRDLRWRGIRRSVRPLLVAAVTIVAGYAIGSARIGLQPATVQVLVWLTPVVFGLQVVAVGGDANTLRAATTRVFTWGALLVGLYGIVQFYAVPGWDAFWMDSVSMSSIGSPEPYKVRVFATLNSPGPLATFLAAAVLYLTDVEHRLRIAAQVTAYACLALSLVRSAWAACLLGLVLVLTMGRPRAKLTALIALAVVTVGVLQISGPLQTVVAERIEESREGRHDDSFQGRLLRYQIVVPHLTQAAFGRGLGATGTDVVAVDAPDGFSAFDSGLLEFGYTLGLPLGTLALAAVTFGTLDLARKGLRTGVLPAGLVAGALSVLVQMLAGNTLTGIGGITFFFLWGLALRQLLDATVPTTGKALTA